MLLTGSGLCYVRSNVYHYGIYNTSSEAPREQLNKNQALLHSASWIATLCSADTRASISDAVISSPVFSSVNVTPTARKGQPARTKAARSSRQLR